MSRPIVVHRRVPVPIPDGAFHSVVVPVADPLDADRLRLVLPDASRDWQENVAALRGEPAALAFLETETRRPLARGQTVRAVVVHYANGEADLVLVGDRAAWDGARLMALAKAAAGSRPVADIPPIPPHRPAPPVRHVTPVIEGEPVDPFGQSRVRDPLPDVVLEQCWGPVGAAGLATVVAAVSIVLGRIGRCATPAVAAYVGPAAPGAGDRTVVVAPQVVGHVPLSELVASVSIDLADPARARHGDSQAGVPACVGVLDPVTVGEGERVVPCIGAPFPLTLCPVVRHGQLTIMAIVRGEDGDADALARLLDVIELVHQQVEHALGTVGDVRLTNDEPMPGTPESICAPGRRIDVAFAEIAAADPGAVALVDDKKAVTYAELNADADRIAAGLVARGTLPGDRVGICLERSADLVAVMLGILRASATYVPMDPAYPDERLEYTASDAGLRLVVTTRTTFPAQLGGILLVEPAALRAEDPGEVRTSPEPGTQPM